MKLIKQIAVFATALAASSTAMAQSENEYLKTFGQLMFERSGLQELKLTPAEFEIFVSGMKMGLEGKGMPENIQQIGPKMLDYLRVRAEANVKKEAEKSEAEAAEFWKKLDKEEGVVKTPSGLAYKVIEQGKGEAPKENSQVAIKYTGTLINGKVFDKSGDVPVTFSLDNTIEGFREGLQKFNKGGKGKLYIPAKLGYANNPLPGIPPNSTLIFDVELADVLPPKAAPQMPAQPNPQPAQPMAVPAAK